MTKMFNIEVTQTVSVKLKKEAFTEQFMEEYRAGFFPFFEMREHAEHIGQLIARGVMDEVTRHYGAEQFIEGYGPIGTFVSEATITETTVDEVVL
ncbi:hypothetical protein ACQW08_06250 [Gluconobacter japonicus]|uniref:hypothetical protein n=1 Tax=Gluconobacter japonicus TaxID=376620 RepID=UPI003D2BD5AF